MLILFAALVGAIHTAVMLWDHGALTALLAAPFGGSILAGLVAAIVAGRGLLGFDDVEPEPVTREATVKVHASRVADRSADQRLV